MRTEQRINKITSVLQHRQKDVAIVCENIHDPHNVSAMLRTCDSAGIPEVHLLYTDEEFPEMGAKSSASARKWVKTNKVSNYDNLKQQLKAKNCTIYATHLNSDAISIYDVDWTQPSAIIMGNEHRGVSKEALDISDQNIFIPMFGMVESLNVSVATAVIIYEIVRQRLLIGNYPNPNLEEEYLNNMLNNWLKK